ncbi:MAG: Ger(x)C family spore germination protein [Syntrophomonadaceae bacterium]
MIRKLGVLSLVLIMVVTQIGCWDKREAEELGVVTGIAIESDGEKGVRVLVQTTNVAALNRSGDGNRGLEFEKAYRNTVVEGENLYDAIKHLSLMTSSQRFYSHTIVIVVSEDYARNQGLGAIMDYIARDPQWRVDVWLLVGRGDVFALMDTKGVLRPVPAQRIGAILKQHKLTGTYAPTRLGEFLKVLSSGTSQPYTAVLESQPNRSKTAGSGILDGVVPEPENNLVMNGTAVFKKDKMVGWLDESQSRGLLYIRGKIGQGEIKFPSPDGSDKVISTEILKAKSKLQPEIINDRVVMNINIEVSSALEDKQGRVKVSDPEGVQVLEEAQRQAVVESIQSALTAAQEKYQADIFGFGEAVHREYPQRWSMIKQQWPDLFPEVETRICVKSSIRHTNLMSDPPNP